MTETRLTMGMPVTVKIADPVPGQAGSIKSAIDAVFDYFYEVDARFSTYKDNSEISKINRGEITAEDWSGDMKEVFRLSEITKNETNGYFDIKTPDGKYDPSGTVKGWAIYNAGKILLKRGFKNFYIDAGGDIQVSGKNEKQEKWSVGIKNPFNQKQIVKVVHLDDGMGIATSGSYIRGDHIYNPKESSDKLKEVVSLTVVGPNVYDADRFATAAFAMGREGIRFIEELDGFEGYSIDKNGKATMTSGFEAYL